MHLIKGKEKKLTSFNEDEQKKKKRMKVKRRASKENFKCLILPFRKALMKKTKLLRVTFVKKHIYHIENIYNIGFVQNVPLVCVRLSR